MIQKVFRSPYTAKFTEFDSEEISLARVDALQMADVVTFPPNFPVRKVRNVKCRVMNFEVVGCRLCGALVLEASLSNGWTLCKCDECGTQWRKR